MFVRIAVFDPLPLFRHGVVVALREAGLGGELPDELFAWMDDDCPRLVLLTLDSAADWERLDRLCGTYDDVLVVALLTDDTVTTHVRALVSGAAAAVSRDAQPSAVCALVEAVIGGRTVLPIDVLRSLTSATSDPTEPGVRTPTPQQMEWLRHLSAGMTVAELAERAGFSERMMFRLLRQLYERMQVKGRTEALLLARERGWL
jgi:DNA-binding NarL/FixJ family response regulator